MECYHRWEQPVRMVLGLVLMLVRTETGLRLCRSVRAREFWQQRMPTPVAMNESPVGWQAAWSLEALRTKYILATAGASSWNGQVAIPAMQRNACSSTQGHTGGWRPHAPHMRVCCSHVWRGAWEGAAWI